MSERLIEVYEGEKISDHCGIVAYFNPEAGPYIPTVLQAGYGVQHRGQQGAGLAFVRESGELVSYIRPGLISDIFTPELSFRENEIRFGYNEGTTQVLLQTRYGSSGNYAETNLQPCLAETSDGQKIAVIHNGEFAVTQKLKELAGANLPEGVSDTLVFTQALARAPGKTIEEKIINLLSWVKGAYSLAIGTPDALYLARDPFGIRPLVLGKLDEGYIAASETHALNKVGAQIKREVRRGEIIRIDKDGLKVIKEGLNGGGALCSFEWIYFHRPDSLLPTFEKADDSDHLENWLSPAFFRYRCGEITADESPVPNASFVVGVPDSGTAFAAGLAARWVPLLPWVIRDHYDPNGGRNRIFQDSNLEEIGDRVLHKLSAIADPRIWEGKVVALGDDSIVRGNVSRRLTEVILALGAREVHWRVNRINFYPCHLGVSTRTKEELIGAQCHMDLREIARRIGATSVAATSDLGVIRALKPDSEIVIPEDPREIYLANGLCGGCVTGLYPVSRDGEVYQLKCRG